MELSVDEHRPRQKVPPPCNGRGTLGSPLTPRPGMPPATLSHRIPCGTSTPQTRIRRNLTNVKLQPSRVHGAFTWLGGRKHPSSQGGQVRGVLYRGFRVKLGLSLLLFSFSSHITDLLLGNLGSGLRSQARVGLSPAKAALADLAGLGRNGRHAPARGYRRRAPQA